MAAPTAPVVTTGTTVTFTGYSGEMLGINGPSIEGKTIETSHLGSVGWRSYIAGKLKDAGEITFQVHHMEYTAALPPVNTLSEMVIDWGGNGDLWTFDAIFVSYTPAGELEEKLVADVTFKGTGAIVPTAST